LVLLALLLAGCGRIVTGSGVVVEETRSAEGVTRLDVSSTFDVTVRQGEGAELVLRIDEAAADRVVAEVQGDTLRLGIPRTVTLRDVTLEAELTVADLEALEVSGASRLTIDGNLESDGLDVDLSGASNIDGDVSLDQLRAEVSGASTLALTGEVAEATLDGSGASSLELAELQIAVLDAELSGASSGVVRVTDELAVDLSGASSLTYAGDPEITSQEVTGASSLEGD
jgi:hypothetical protein